MHRPAGHQPRGGPAHQVRWPDGVRSVEFVQFGVQAPSVEDAAPAVARLLELLSSPNGPAKADRGRQADASGRVDEIVLCYWTDRETWSRWWTSEQVRTWWHWLPLTGPIGHWCEALRTPVDRIETMYSAPVPLGPAAIGAAMEPTDLHDYRYAALDRFASGEDFSSPGGEIETDLPEGASTFGRRVTVTGVPANLCFIRTAQHLAEAPADQVRTYREGVEPGYVAGVDGLRRGASGCLSARLVRELDTTGGELPATSALAWWRCIGDLLGWAHGHPDHQRILRDFWTSIVEPYGTELRLVLWHEVHVTPAGGVRMSYVNCHPDTGLLGTLVQTGESVTEDYA